MTSKQRSSQLCSSTTQTWSMPSLNTNSRPKCSRPKVHTSPGFYRRVETAELPSGSSSMGKSWRNQSTQPWRQWLIRSAGARTTIRLSSSQVTHPWWATAICHALTSKPPRSASHPLNSPPSRLGHRMVKTQTETGDHLSIIETAKDEKKTIIIDPQHTPPPQTPSKLPKKGLQFPTNLTRRMMKKMGAVAIYSYKITKDQVRRKWSDLTVRNGVLVMQLRRLMH